MNKTKHEPLLRACELPLHFKRKIKNKREAYAFLNNNHKRVVYVAFNGAKLITASSVRKLLR
jgi:hypothetical protein